MYCKSLADSDYINPKSDKEKNIADSPTETEIKKYIYSQFNTFIETQSTYDRDSKELKKKIP